MSNDFRGAQTLKKGTDINDETIDRSTTTASCSDNEPVYDFI